MVAQSDNASTACTTDNRDIPNIHVRLNTLLAEAIAILGLIESQIQVLDELYEIVKCICRDQFDPCYNQNTVRLVYSYSRENNALNILSPAFEMALSERKSYREKFKGLIKNGEKAQTTVSRIKISYPDPRFVYSALFNYKRPEVNPTHVRGGVRVHEKSTKGSYRADKYRCVDLVAVHSPLSLYFL
jgi:hypothetical protein